jgi:CRISPR-associated protein Cas1
MNPLHLSGWGIKLAVEELKSSSYLKVTDGRQDDKQSSVMRFRPRRFPYSSVIVDGFSGYVSLRSAHWLAKNGTPVFILDPISGDLLSSVLPAGPIKADVKLAQLHATEDFKKKFIIAHAFVKAKIARSMQLLDWLGQRYDIDRELRMTKREASNLGRARTVNELRTVEGRVALRYWEAFRQTLPKWLDFQGRMTTTHQNNASDPFNAALNYGYGFLEAECRMAINVVGLEPSVGFLHDFSDYQTKESLVYDLQEPFRWLVDVSVCGAFESGALNLKDFYFTGDDYRYRFKFEAKERFVELLRDHFNAGVVWKSQRFKWDTVIEQKAQELGRFLVGKSAKLDLNQPAPILERFDGIELRDRIKSLTSEQAKAVGIGKSTLYTLRQHAREERSFRLYGKVSRKLQTLTD